MKKIVVTLSFLVISFANAQMQTGTCPVTGKTYVNGKEVVSGGPNANAETQPVSTETKNATVKTSISFDKNREWWPNQLNLNVLRQNSSLSNPMGAEFDYAKAFETLDYSALKKDLKDLINIRLVRFKLSVFL